jgi:phage shock protein A
MKRINLMVVSMLMLGMFTFSSCSEKTKDSATETLEQATDDTKDNLAEAKDDIKDAGNEFSAKIKKGSG